ncbi:hypothetical protein [Enterococcus sp. 12F9_DIV0723]|uniref:hypothetical protein n=1 Tax=Enterococcus sp. 12F9_DIV0723 TaxID=1834169 RepID=UPI000B3ECFC5|nr:hypothetical protein [Enterococcus sp. 12F9_DIV0723]
MKDYFFTKLKKDVVPYNWQQALNNFSKKNDKQVYLIREPLSKTNEEYEYKDAFVILIPGYKIGI